MKSVTMKKDLSLASTARAMTVVIQLQIDQLQEQFGKVEIHADQEFFDNDWRLKDELFFKGICNGVNNSVAKSDMRISNDADIAIHITQLEFSISPNQLSDSELEDLTVELESMAFQLTDETLENLS